MELARNVTLGQYIPGDSLLHRLDPRAKIVAWTLVATGLFMTRSFTGLAVMALFLLLVVYLGELPLGYVLRGLLPMLPLLAFIYSFQVLFSGSLYPDAKVVIWEWGIFKITGEGL